MSTYQPNIPQENDFISVSQGDIQTNFEIFAKYVNQNHVSHLSESYGKHKFTTLPMQAAFPTTGADEIALVCHEDFTGTGNPELFFKPENSLPADPVTRMTATPGIGARFIVELDSKGNPVLRNSYNINKFELLKLNSKIGETSNILQRADLYYVQFEKPMDTKFYIPTAICQTKDTLQPGQNFLIDISQASEKGFVMEFVFQLYTTGGNPIPKLQKATVIIFGQISDQ